MSSLSLLFDVVKRSLGKPPPRTLPLDPPCPVCKAAASYLDSVDFNKNCEEARGLRLPRSGELVGYFLCDGCGFCFAPELFAWPVDKFEARIYNDDYVAVDPDYKAVRPTGNADMVDQTFAAAGLRHIDYGGGSGLLSRLLVAKSWDSHSYDPFVNKDVDVRSLGQFDLVTAFEVFEHVPDIDALFRDLQSLMKPDGMILFSTLLSDGQIAKGLPLTWWYAAPRNGHISLFSAQSLQTCLRHYGFSSASASANLHTAFRQIPPWAKHIFP